MVMALEGIKVIDASQVAAVPMCARHLADYGADVIHIESAKTGDSWRNLQAGIGGGPAGVPSDIPYNWEAFNRNKKSLALDLATEDGRKIAHRLVEQADVFVTNLRLYERAKFGLEYETLKKINPRLVYGSVTGHGLHGPEKDAPAYDTTVYFARSGINHMLTVPGMSPPNSRAAFGDVMAAITLAFGIVTALYARDRVGEGQQVHTSLLNAGIYQLTFDMSSALSTGQDEATYKLETFEGTDEERQERDKLMAESQDAIGRLADFIRARLPNPTANFYQTKDGKWIRFNALQAERYWGKFCHMIEREDLEHDPRYATIDDRKANSKELYYLFKEIFLTKTMAEWRPLIKAIPSSPVQNLLEVIDDPQVKANNMFLDYEHPTYGPMKIMASPLNLSKTPATIREPAPEFGQHTEEILLEAGFEWDEIEKFKDKGVIPE
jgi:crotonobetainyl-CoA:carnitine CoA-transferase CaiB-like acyl-CoA transferase